MEGEERSDDLGTGTTLANFQASGKVPDVSDKLNRWVRLGAIDVAVPLSILAEISSGPVDLVMSRLNSNSRTLSSVQRRAWGQLS